MIRARRLRSKIEASGVHEHRASRRKAEADETRRVSEKRRRLSRHASRTWHYESRDERRDHRLCRGDIVCKLLESAFTTTTSRLRLSSPAIGQRFGSLNRGRRGCASRYTKEEFRGMEGRIEEEREVGQRTLNESSGTRKEYRPSFLSHSAGP